MNSFMPVGGTFLLDPVAAARFVIPEECTTEQRQLAESAREFIEREVVPRDAEIEAGTPGVMPALLKKAGALGLLMIEIPERYGGLNLGKVTASIIAEAATGQGSFIVAFICHNGIGTLPILYYGSAEQRQRYLPRLATGELLGAYALTEAESGSDALAAKTHATKTPDGSAYLLNGEKLFVTNGGFADLYTIFAKVDGERFTAFLVERGTPGLTVGPEEHKLGIHGSSTVPLGLQDVRVPVENVLGEVGKGHRIAFNILNVGRYKLGAACIGGAKRILAIGVKYVRERRQFGHALADFGAIQQKIAECAMRIFIGESMGHRYASALDAGLAGSDWQDEAAYERLRDVTKDLTIEASIVKVYGTEASSFIADEVLQMHGGYGFLTEYAPARYYTDLRINRIFEGTNEINRLLITGTLLKRIGDSTLDFLGAFQQLLAELKKGFPAVAVAEPLAVWQDQVNQLKKLALYVGGVAVNTFGTEIEERQPVLMDVANLIIATYAADSGLGRVLKIWRTAGPEAAALPAALVTTYLAERLPRCKILARQTLVNIAGGDAAVAKPYLKAVERFLPFVPADTAAGRCAIAAHVLAYGGYGW
ncbi:MAG: acyl-CoA dehydrogenase family protein [Deltaproteobacteria bacterium]|nr:acyl-CoA dehydrogenase family protein [Deltaproteobacteria bacterium]